MQTMKKRVVRKNQSKMCGSLQHGTYSLRDASFDTQRPHRRNRHRRCHRRHHNHRKWTACVRASIRTHTCQRNNNKSARDIIKTQTMKKRVVRKNQRKMCGSLRPAELTACVTRHSTPRPTSAPQAPPPPMPSSPPQPPEQGSRVCVQVFENTRVSATTTNQRATISKCKQ